MVCMSISRKRSLEFAAETSSLTTDLQQKKKMKKVLATKARKTTKKLKDGKEEISKTVTVSEEVTNKRVSKKKLIMDL